MKRLKLFFLLLVGVAGFAGCKQDTGYNRMEGQIKSIYFDSPVVEAYANSTEVESELPATSKIGSFSTGLIDSEGKQSNADNTEIANNGTSWILSKLIFWDKNIRATFDAYVPRTQASVAGKYALPSLIGQTGVYDANKDFMVADRVEKPQGEASIRIALKFRHKLSLVKVVAVHDNVTITDPMKVNQMIFAGTSSLIGAFVQYEAASGKFIVSEGGSNEVDITAQRTSAVDFSSATSDATYTFLAIPTASAETFTLAFETSVGAFPAAAAEGGAVRLEGGKIYTFPVTFGREVVKVGAPTITEWVDGGETVVVIKPAN